MKRFELKMPNSGRALAFTGRLVSDRTTDQDPSDDPRPRWFAGRIWLTQKGTYVVETTRGSRLVHAYDQCSTPHELKEIPAGEHPSEGSIPCRDCDPHFGVEVLDQELPIVRVEVYKAPKGLIDQLTQKDQNGRIRESWIARDLMSDLAAADERFAAAYNTWEVE